MAKRRGRKKGGAPDAVAGILLTVLGLVLIAALGGAAWWIKGIETSDPQTNCPPSGPKAVHLVIFDQSDPVSPQQAQRIRQVMQQLKMAAQVGDRFDIYSFEGDTRNVLEPRLVMCRPPEKANEWIENVEKARRRYEDFGRKLDAIVDELLKASTRPTSPIIESLRAASITSFGPLSESKEIAFRVTLFSDMIQHSELCSHYRNDPDFGQLARSAAWPSSRPDLKSAETEVFYLLRPDAKRAGGRAIQTRGHQNFWEQLLPAAGAQLRKIQAF